MVRGIARMIALLIALLFALPPALSLAAAPAMLRVRLQPSVNKATVELPLEQYVAGVVSGESSILRSDEALKAMAVAARTYAIYNRGRHAAQGYDLCGTTHCQRLGLGAVTPRIEAAVNATLGEMLWYQGKPACACYSRNCGGVTEDASAVWPALAVPYLRSHPDPYCTRHGSSAWRWSANPMDIVKALRNSQLQTPPEIGQIEVAQRTASGRARVLILAGGAAAVRISASTFRFAMGRELGWNTVRSDRFDVQPSNARMDFHGSGEGHGVGLCQRGADEMGMEGHGYREILDFYYPGAMVGLTGRGLAWNRLAGETIALMTTQPDTDRTLLDLAGRELRAITQRTNLPAPGAGPSRVDKIEIRVYPDVATFRNATGEPGWVSAYTVGNRIQMQPVAMLRNRGLLEPTLRHELLHVLVEAQAKAGLPVWFREGLTGYLEHAGGPAADGGSAPQDADLRQTVDAQRARLAYANATRKVTDLASRYGEGAVVGWLKTGLPREVTNASATAAATKSR